MTTPSPLRFAAIGLDHGHIIGMTSGMLDAGCECAGYWTESATDPLDRFKARFGSVNPVEDRSALLEDPTISLILIASPPNERADRAIEAMQHGKDVMVDKPGCISLEELERIQAVAKETGRIWSVNFSERFQVPSVLAASRLVRQGEIGQVVQVLGMGPHRLKRNSRAPWFFDRKQYGGILVDIASHQIDQFLHFTGLESAEIAHSAVGNFAHSDLPDFEDFGEIALFGDGAQGYIRVDWFTADGLPTWGDGRLFILGTEGTIELRKYIDLQGRPGKDHLFLVNGCRYDYINCAEDELTYFSQLKDDILNRTETACSQAHTYRVMELAIKAQMKAQQRGALNI